MILSGHIVQEDVQLPGPRSPIKGRASRCDTYPIAVSRCTEQAVDDLCRLLNHSTVALISDETVDRLYGGEVADLLEQRGVAVHRAAFPPGEQSKSVDVAVGLLNWLASTTVSRRDAIVSLGGGVVMDTVGWAASSYMRGIPYINMPTTLLAHVDAAIGGKVAVDHQTAKNLIGAFYQPAGVVSNVGFLRTLDPRQISAGLAEAIKKGVIASPGLFGLVESSLAEVVACDGPTLEYLVRAASAVKVELIARDPYEVDLRRPLNFGHSAGHALETVTGYGPVLHGEAVAFGMSIATRIARARRICSPEFEDRLLALLRRANLPTSLRDLPVTVEPAALTGALDKVRLIRDGQLRFVLPIDLGKTVIVEDVADAEVCDAMAVG